MKGFPGRWRVSVGGGLATGVMLWGGECEAQVLFSDHFDQDSSSQWEVVEDSLSETPDATVIFGHDYTQDQFTITRGGVSETLKVPKNPFGLGETTLGLKMIVNSDDEAAEASVSLYPKEVDFDGDYALRFEMFMSYNGPAYGGTGSTEFTTMGVGHSGELVAMLDGNQAIDGDGTFFAVSGEGGASRDYRAYSGDGFGMPTFFDEQAARVGFTDMDGDGIGEYNTFSDGPMEKVFPFPPHETKGAPGKGWVSAEVRKLGGRVTWILGGQIIAELAADQVLADGNKVMIGYSDPFSSIANPGSENFVIFDHLRVVRLTSDQLPPVVGVSVAGERVRDEGTGSEAFVAAEVDEGAGSAEFRFVRSSGIDAALTVPFRLEGSAVAGEDYQTIDPAEVTFGPGDSEVSLFLKLIDDAKEELNETIVLIISPSDAYQTASGKFATLPLVDNGDRGIPEPDELAGAVVIYEEGFEKDVSGAWQVNRSSDDTSVVFGYDYSVDGIPSPPGGDGESTLGLKFTANESLGEAAHITASPMGQDFSGDYVLSFDLWLNFNGPIPGGGSGSTEFAAAGIGTSGDHVQTADEASDGAWFLLTGEGGSSRDYRFFLNDVFLTEETGVYLAGSQNSDHGYYGAVFPSGKSAPEPQMTEFPQQRGKTAPGQPAFEWIPVQLIKAGDRVTWSMKGTDIAVASQSTAAFSDSGTFFLGYSDWFSSVSDNVDLSFVLFDNVKVYQLPARGIAIERIGSGARVTFTGTLESAAEISGPWRQVEGAVSPYEVEVGAGAAFFRVAP